jgi:pimeloyl-ACP methyl ester carboxylesterase
MKQPCAVTNTTQNHRASLKFPLIIKDKDIYDKIMERDFSPAMNWYRSEMAGLSLPDDTNATPPLDPKLHLPVLYVESSLDPVSSGERAIPGLQALISDLTVKKVATGHWLQLEKADEVNAILEEFVTGVDTKRKEKV